MPEQEASALAELSAMLAAVTGEDQRWERALAPGSRLEADLRLDSLEIAALARRLRDRYGPAVDLPGYLAGLSMDELVALTVGDLLAYLAAPAHSLPARPAGEAGR